MNERVTEDIVRDHFKGDALFNAIRFEEQITKVAKAKKCLKAASKKQNGRPGFPEFIITIPALPDYIIVIECKADPAKHESVNRGSPIDYAVDGALHYSGYLSTEYNVISIGASGTDKLGFKVSSFIQRKGEDAFTEIDSKLLGIYSYITMFKDEVAAREVESAEITKTAISLNVELNDYSIVEYERCTIVSAILLALQNESFKQAYKASARSASMDPTPKRITKLILTSINDVLTDNDIDAARISAMMGEYNRIQAQPISYSPLVKKKKDSEEEPNFVIRDIAEKLEGSILPLITMGAKGYDVLGRFYREFIRYAGTDKKSGLVLTPQHITELFCDLVDLNVDDVVLDSCCGTGGFLIAAMKRMFELAGGDQDKRAEIKEAQLVGVEKRTDMFTFACSNMMMSGDGKSHIYQGDSFSPSTISKVKDMHPTVAFLNPPYDVGEDGQLEFVENALNCLDQGGRCAAIVQMSCVTSSGARATLVRDRLLKRHTLLGVLSMPDALFDPVGVITCIVVFRAHAPQPKAFKPYFGYYKDDGFVKTKNYGRIDKGRWDAIRDIWVDSFTNRTVASGRSVLAKVTAADEWCAEAYMETDYSSLSESDFERSLRDYVAFKVKHG